MATSADDWYEESSPNLAATLDPNHELDKNSGTNHTVNESGEPDVVTMFNCSLPTPFFK